MITGCNILSAPLPCPVYSGLQHQHVPLIAMKEIIPMDENRQGNDDRKRTNEKIKREWQREKRAREEKESNLGAWLLCAELVESDTSPCGWHMEPIVVAAQGRLGAGNQRRSGWLWQPLHRRGEADGAEGWYRCQSPAKSAICHGEPAKSHWPRHAAKAAGDLWWPVIMSWDVSFQHGRFPAAANLALV